MPWLKIFKLVNRDSFIQGFPRKRACCVFIGLHAWDSLKIPTEVVYGLSDFYMPSRIMFNSANDEKPTI